MAHAYNIVEIEKMSMNELNTAIGRTRDWSFIGVNPSKNREKYEQVRYPHTCRMLEPKNDISEAFIYEKRFTPSQELFYIGRTNNEAKREADHKINPTNKDMAAALLRLHETKTVARWWATPKQIDQLETEMIVAAIKRGETLLNKKKVKIQEVKKVTPIVHTVIQTRFTILEDEAQSRYRVKARANDGADLSKTFRWTRCGKETAYAVGLSGQEHLCSDKWRNPSYDNRQRWE